MVAEYKHTPIGQAPEVPDEVSAFASYDEITAPPRVLHRCVARRPPIAVAAVITVDPVDGTRSARSSGDRVLVIGGKLAGRLAPKTYGLRATCAAPAERGRTVGTPEGPHEVARVAVSHPPADLLHGDSASGRGIVGVGPLWVGCVHGQRPGLQRQFLSALRRARFVERDALRARQPEPVFPARFYQRALRSPDVDLGDDLGGYSRFTTVTVWPSSERA